MMKKINFALASAVSLALFSVSSVHARYENDVRLGTLLEAEIPQFVYPKDYSDTSEQPELEEEVKIYFEQGYHPVSVLFYAMRNGMSTNEVLDIAEDAGLVREHLSEAALSLDSVLPGGVCGTSYFIKDGGSIPGSYSLTSLKEELQQAANDGSAGNEEPVLADIVAKYFDDHDVISINQEDPSLDQVHHSNWEEATALIPGLGVPDNVEEFLASDIPAHIYASADELLALVEQSNDYWYFSDSPIQQGRINAESLDDNAPIQVMLYTDAHNATVSPSQIDRIIAAKESGEILPVMFFYSNANLRPLSQISGRIGFPELANAYIRNGIKVAPLPSWEQGQYHTLASGQQLKDLLDLPERDDIPEERYTKALSTIDNGRPLQIAFVGGRIFIGDPDRAVAMIEDGGHDFLPLNVSYVDLEPDENNFSICENAFPFAGSGLGAIGGPTPSGVVVPPDEEPCVPGTRTDRFIIEVDGDSGREEREIVVETPIPCPVN